MKAFREQFFYKISAFLYPYLVLLPIAVSLLLLFSKEELYFAVNHLHTSFTDIFFRYITELGASIGCIIISLILILINFRKGFLLASSYVITFTVSQILKYLVKAPRPYLFFTKRLHEIYLVKGVSMLSMYSFPSGHSVSAFSAAVVLTYISKNKNWGYFWLLMATLVAFSRLYLSEHFLRDVTAGSALGVLLTSFWIYYIDQKLFLHKKDWDRGIFSQKTFRKN